MATPKPRPPAMPRWVKVTTIIALIVLVVVVIAALTGNHEPGRHGIDDGRDTHATVPV